MFNLSFINETSNLMSRNYQQKAKNVKYSGPFGATQMWNDLVKAFSQGMPLQRHRKALRRHDNCFMASDAVIWLCRFLEASPDFGIKVNNNQVEMLLKKFYDAKVFEEVDRSKPGFQSGNKLYKFCEDECSSDPSCFLQSSPVPHHLSSSMKFLKSYFKPSANKGFSMPKKKLEEEFVGSRSNMSSKKGMPLKSLNVTFPRLGSASAQVTSAKIPPVHLRSVTTFNMEDEHSTPGNADVCGSKANWGEVKNCVNERDAIVNEFMNSFLSSVKFGDFNGLASRAGHGIDNLIHNVSIVNKNGAPTNIDKKDQLPLWLVTALKSLAPGSLDEKLTCDTVTVIHDFINLQKKDPLISKDLYNIITRSLDCYNGLFKMNQNQMNSEASKNKNCSRNVTSMMDSFEFIDSSPSCNRSLSNLKTDLKMVQPMAHALRKSLNVLTPTSQASKPLSFFGGVKHLKRTKKEKKSKDRNSFLMPSQSFHEMTWNRQNEPRTQLYASNKDLVLQNSITTDEQIPRDGIRSAENLSFYSTNDWRISKDSPEANALMEVLRHVLLLILPCHRRMLMILTRLLAKSGTGHCQEFHLKRLYDTFQDFIFGSHENDDRRSAIFHFMMDCYSEIFQVPPLINKSVLAYKHGEAKNQKENLMPHGTDLCKNVPSSNNIKSILKRQKFEAVRF